MPSVAQNPKPEKTRPHRDLWQSVGEAKGVVLRQVLSPHPCYRPDPPYAPYPPYSPQARLVAVALAEHVGLDDPSGDAVCFPSVSLLMRETGLPRRTVSRALTALCRGGPTDPPQVYLRDRTLTCYGRQSRHGPELHKAPRCSRYVVVRAPAAMAAARARTLRAVAGGKAHTRPSRESDRAGQDPAAPRLRELTAGERDRLEALREGGRRWQGETFETA